MKGRGPAATYLGPILDTYMGAAVALVGCASRGIERYSCEPDVLVVTEEKHPSTSLKMGDAYADLVFATEAEVMDPPTPELALAIATAKPVRDSGLVLTTGSASALANFSGWAKAATRMRVTSALKTAVRAEESVAGGATLDADFWLLAASYEFAFALLLSRDVIPSPSHLLAQLRTASMGAPQGFEGVSIGAGLEAATRTGCGTRLDGLGVLHDLVREGSDSAAGKSEWAEARDQVMGAKARELVVRAELAECYSFLGQELVAALLAVQRLHPRRTIGSLASGRDMLLGERLVKQLGLTRGEKDIRAALEVLRRQVAVLTKRV